MNKETSSEEQVLHNELSFEINQELIHLMKRIVEIQRKNEQLEKENQKYKELFSELNKYLSESQLTRSVKDTRIYGGINANYEIKNILKGVE